MLQAIIQQIPGPTAASEPQHVASPPPDQKDSSLPCASPPSAAPPCEGGAGGAPPPPPPPPPPDDTAGDVPPSELVGEVAPLTTSGAVTSDPQNGCDAQELGCGAGGGRPRAEESAPKTSPSGRRARRASLQHVGGDHRLLRKVSGLNVGSVPSSLLVSPTGGLPAPRKRTRRRSDFNPPGLRIKETPAAASAPDTQA